MMPLLLAATLLLPDTGRAWRAGVLYGFEDFTSVHETWHSANVHVGRRFARGTVIGEFVYARRFHQDRGGFAIDAYHDLWRRAYGNVRVQHVPGGTILPKNDVAAEAFQGLAGGWEISGGYRRMAFDFTASDIWSAGVARYVGDWYLRARALLIPQPGTTGALLVSVRRYLATPEEYLDVHVGIGSEVIVADYVPGVGDVRATRSAALTWRTSLTQGLGIQIGGAWNDTEGLPVRRGLTFGVTHRW